MAVAAKPLCIIPSKLALLTVCHGIELATKYIHSISLSCELPKPRPALFFCYSMVLLPLFSGIPGVWLVLG